MDLLAVLRTDPGCDWERELVWRMAQARPEDTVRGLFFNGTLGAVRRLGDAEAVQCCLLAADEERFVDLFQYPVRSLLRMLYFAAGSLGPALGGVESVLRDLGRHIITTYLASPVGRATAVLVHGRPRRMLESAPDIYRQMLGFGEVSVTFTGPRQGLVALRGDFLPAACHEGALEHLLHAMGGQGVKVERQWVKGLDGEYAFSWE
jgi:uncharacterized protein (TIGR02265 family)